MSQKVVVSTRTKDESCGRLYVLDHKGDITKTEPFTMQHGTLVSAFNLFQNYPVRRQYATKNSTKTNKNALEIIKRYESYVLTLIEKICGHSS